MGRRRPSRKLVGSHLAQGQEEGPGGGVGGSERGRGFWLHLDFPWMGMTFSAPCTSPSVACLLSPFHLCIFSPTQQSALLTVGSQCIFTDLVKGWVNKAQLYNSSQRNPRMLTDHAAKLLGDVFLADSVDVGHYGGIIWRRGSDVANAFAYENTSCCRAIGMSNKDGAILALWQMGFLKEKKKYNFNPLALLQPCSNICRRPVAFPPW